MLVQIIEYICFLFRKIISCWYLTNLFWISRLGSQITLIDRKIIYRRNTLIFLIVICHVQHFHISSWSKWVLIFIRIVYFWWVNDEFCVYESWFVIDNTALTFLKWLAKSVLKALFLALLTKIRAYRFICIKLFCLWNLFLNLLRNGRSQYQNQIVIQIVVNTKFLCSIILYLLNDLLSLE